MSRSRSISCCRRSLAVFSSVSASERLSESVFRLSPSAPISSVRRCAQRELKLSAAMLAAIWLMSTMGRVIHLA